MVKHNVNCTTDSFIMEQFRDLPKACAMRYTDKETPTIRTRCVPLIQGYIGPVKSYQKIVKTAGKNANKQGLTPIILQPSMKLRHGSKSPAELGNWYGGEHSHFKKGGKGRIANPFLLFDTPVHFDIEKFAASFPSSCTRPKVALSTRKSHYDKSFDYDSRVKKLNTYVETSDTFKEARTEVIVHTMQILSHMKK